jgi:metal iron transporter
MRLRLFPQPFIRRLLTRLLSLIPAIIVAAATGRNGVNQLLVASQVVLSIVLPFMIFPLVWLTSSKDIMSVKDPVAYLDPTGLGEDVERTERKPVDFSTGKLVTVVGYMIWLTIVVANAYVIVMLCLGNSG